MERALTFELPNGKWAALADADVDDWCLTKYLVSTDKKNTLTSVMYSPVDVVTYYATPWKIVMAADKPGELLEHNDIIQNLNPPCEIADAAACEKFKIIRFEQDQKQKDRIYLDIHMTPFFPAKSFVIKLDGTKGDDGTNWNTNYEQA